MPLQLQQLWPEALCFPQLIVHMIGRLINNFSFFLEDIYTAL